MSAVRNLIAGKVQQKRQALGNSNRGLKELCCDLLHEDIGTNAKRIVLVANSCFLCPSTVARVMDCEERYSPQAQTLERIMRYYGIRLTADNVAIKAEFQNKPKIANAEEEGRYIDV